MNDDMVIKESLALGWKLIDDLPQGYNPYLPVIFKYEIQDNWGSIEKHYEVRLLQYHPLLGGWQRSDLDENDVLLLWFPLESGAWHTLVPTQGGKP